MVGGHTKQPGRSKLIYFFLNLLLTANGFPQTYSSYLAILCLYTLRGHIEPGKGNRIWTCTIGVQDSLLSVSELSKFSPLPAQIVPRPPLMSSYLLQWRMVGFMHGAASHLCWWSHSTYRDATLMMPTHTYSSRL